MRIERRELAATRSGLSPANRLRTTSSLLEHVSDTGFEKERRGRVPAVAIVVCGELDLRLDHVILGVRGKRHVAPDSRARADLSAGGVRARQVVPALIQCLLLRGNVHRRAHYGECCGARELDEVHGVESQHKVGRIPRRVVGVVGGEGVLVLDERSRAQCYICRCKDRRDRHARRVDIKRDLRPACVERDGQRYGAACRGHHGGR
mmetsp:Transcript_38432/g.101336  ORF Transcript_38432/g.101336 Transcript_38432/m.101336 type:complete len:206 (-) Transcript_38432:882-1499(-)